MKRYLYILIAVALSLSGCRYSKPTPRTALTAAAPKKFGGINNPTTLPTTLVKWQGTWSSSTAYNPNDLVVYSSSTWLCLSANTNSAPSGTNGNWQSVGAAGGGATGAAGGDLSGTYPNPTVAQINGATVPASASLLGSNSSRQLTTQSAHNLAVLLVCSDSSGSGTAQSCTTSPSFTPAAGDCVNYTTTTANTGTSLTVNINSFGAKNVAKWQTSTTLAAGDVQANSKTRMCYDGTNWEIDTIGNAPASGGPTYSTVPAPPSPSLGTTGTAGSTSYSYCVVAIQDPAGSQHTPCSTTATITTGNATLTPTNSITLSNYMLTSSATSVRGYNIYRTASGGSPSTTGLIASNVDPKSFVDTGLAGDATSAPTTNTTLLMSHPQLLPACAAANGAIFGIDAPPCVPTVYDDEFNYTYQIKGANSPAWTACDDGTNHATLTLTGSMLSLLGNTASNDYEGICLSLSGLSAPYTVILYADSLVPYEYSGCEYDLRESSTGKMGGFELSNQQSRNSSGSWGFLLGAKNWSSYSSASYPGAAYQEAVGATGYYFVLENDGTNLIFKWSNTGDGVAFNKWFSEPLTSVFTSGPNQIALGTSANSGLTAAAQCNTDYVRIQSGLTK